MTLKRDIQYAHIPIIMLTGMAQEGDRKKGEILGANAYLIKPCEPSKLLSALEEVLER